MIVPETNLRPARRAGRLSRRKLGRIIAAIVVLGAIVWVGWVELQIRYYATHDEARPASAIAVFGAAEYDGRPSPVLRARLDHGLALYRQNIAPLVITLGGGAPTDRHSEGGVGRAYLLAHGVPDSAIIAETKSDNTEQSVRRLAKIARANHLGLIIVVSDGTHLFRVHALCSSMGLNVLTSPRPEARALPLSLSIKRTVHEILSYTFWRFERLVGLGG
ncbi:MAG TPA: YdcF family protein [Acidobacteriaceae bacterium]|nr:YdcF family protein [Acidobacteriaceae bacterium]